MRTRGEGEGLIEQEENVRLGWALPNTRCLRYPHLNHWIFHSSLLNIKTREHENKREGWRLDWAKREHEVWLGFAQHSLFAYPHLNHWIFHSSLFTFHSSLKPLDFSLFTFHSSPKPLDFSLFVLHSSLKPLDFSLFSFHFSLPLRFAKPPHNHLTSLVDSHLTFFLYPCSTSAWCSSGQRLTHIISRFTATCGSVEGK